MTRKSRAWENFHPSWWAVIIAGGLVAVFSVAIVREVFRTRQVSSQVARLQTQITQEEHRQEQLQELIAYLGSQTYQEREARLQLGLRKPGEKVIVVPAGSVKDTNGQIITNADNASAAENSGSLPQRWWHYFFGPRSG